MSTRIWAPSTRMAPGTPRSSTGRDCTAASVAEFQRARMLAATIDAVCECGAAYVTVADIVERAGMSRRTFYELYRDREECVLAALDDAVEHLAASTAAAYEPELEWCERIRAGLVALLTFLDADPATARCLLVESLGAEPKARRLRERAVAATVEALAEGSHEGSVAGASARLIAEGIAGGVLSILHDRVLEGPSRPLVELTNELMSMIVLPFRGTTAARREIERPAPRAAPPRRVEQAAPGALKELRVRLTYRTARVLTAVQERPGGSNRAIGEAAGISDHGQASKLLARLQKLGLVHNESGDAGRGAQNAWALTANGARIVRSISANRSDGRLDAAGKAHR
ncbi:MAG TPA: TetR family transcriptional regulator [Solirubrobacteraceae bacterium]|nr:TetR family transcriptional regulator [Solirubrobacteraceae bacterium]